MKLTMLFGAAALTLAAIPNAQAADFYAGKTLTIIAATAPGGGYDTHARLVQRHLGKHIPGNPNVIVQNMPAGGGMAAANHMYAIARKDGTEIGLFNRNTLFSPMLGDDLAKFKSEEFQWIGTPASYSDNAYTFFIQSKLPYKTLEEARKASPELAIGNIGSVPVRITKDALGVNMRLIGGYTGAQLDIAFERGEIDGAGSSYANLLMSHKDWIERPLLRFLVQYGSDKRLPALKDVPTAREMAKNPEDLQLIKFSELALTLGFPIAAPPGAPADLVAILRKAFDDTMKDPEYLADSKKSQMEYSPKNGAGLQADFVDMAKAPDSVKQRYKKLVDEERR